VTLSLPAAAAADAPYFGLLDRPTDRSRIGLDLNYVHVDTLDFPDGVIRIEPHLEYVSDGKFGGYVSLPFHGTFIAEETDASVGGIELGGLFVARIPLVPLVLRGGITLPTASSDDVVVNALAAQSRTVDAVQALPETFALRASASLVSNLPMIGFRADIGVDLPVTDLADDIDVEHDPIIHIGGGAAVGLLGFKLALEIVNVFSASDSTQNTHQLGLSAHFGLGPLNTYVGAATLLDGFVEDDQEQVFSGMAGVAINLP
jgi:hypothetical protein